MIAADWAGRPLLLEPTAARALFAGAGAVPSSPQTPASSPGAVAVISVRGPLVARAHPWLASYEAIGQQLRAAAASPEVAAIVLDLDTPGGIAAGALELAAVVREVAQAKPVTAVVNFLAASGGYAIASAASEVVVAGTATVGSIGVVVVHVDYSRQLDGAGITPTLIYSGSRKVDGNGLQPLADNARADLQREVNALHAAFCTSVGLGRGSSLPADAARRTEARMFTGREAIAAGLADRIGTLDQVIAELTAGNRRTSPQARSTAMSTVHDRDAVVRRVLAAQGRVPTAPANGESQPPASALPVAPQPHTSIAERVLRNQQKLTGHVPLSKRQP